MDNEAGTLEITFILKPPDASLTPLFVLATFSLTSVIQPNDSLQECRAALIAGLSNTEVTESSLALFLGKSTEK